MKKLLRVNLPQTQILVLSITFHDLNYLRKALVVFMKPNSSEQLSEMFLKYLDPILPGSRRLCGLPEYVYAISDHLPELLPLKEVIK